MNAREDVRSKIKTALSHFQDQDLLIASYKFWAALGFQSQRRFDQTSYTFEEFQRFFSASHVIRDDQALKGLWKEMHILYQVTETEIKRGLDKDLQMEIEGLRNNAVQPDEIKSYLFAAVEINQAKISRTKLATFTREINRCFAMPVLLLIKTESKLTLSVINRRLHKRDQTKDVLEKVTMIKDIDFQNPHRGHLDILNKIHLLNLEVQSINDLHKAWGKQLSTKELNFQFYKEITAWYRSAYEIVNLFYQGDLSDEVKDETKKHFLVKLICRLMFCWFIKEKGLIPAPLLELTNDTGERYPLTSDAEEPDSNSYYRGILRTLFFDCLNTPAQKRNLKNMEGQRYISGSLDHSALNRIPYLNGGLFDRFDEFLEDNSKLDDNIPDSLVSIPNKIFYGLASTTRRANEGIPGLNEILCRYKFTVEENTPLEEDVALDPELLGMVFENLLAELDPDPDIARNARKNSGSYYTPREVIDFMVNDSLVLYLQSCAKSQSKEQYNDQIKFLVYHEVINSDPAFDGFVVEALDKLRVLDPACGSGAFPMGMLHKMTRILDLVDPDNVKWIKFKLQAVDPAYKSEFARNLKEHFDNYARKIGILRDSIYGADIQPLAGHIAKLRFFISLIVDQDTHLDKDNCGVTPLPNLETNIICVDSLRQFPLQMGLHDVSHDLTKAVKQYYDFRRSPDEKEKLLDDIANYLSLTFENYHWKSDRDTAQRTHQFWKRWFHYGNNPCPFFDFEVFFPQVAESGGFDIVIGNPPYGGNKIDEDVKEQLHLGSRDPYGAFIARFLNIPSYRTPLKERGILAYIVSDTFMTIKTHRELRNQMLDNYVHKMVRMHPDTFKQVVNTAVILCQKAPKGEKIPDTHHCLMVDMTNISIHQDLDKFLEILYDIEEIDKVQQYSDSVYAIYKYTQNIIRKSTLEPFFVAPENIFTLLHDVRMTRNADNPLERIVELNGKPVVLVKLGDIARVSQGLATGDNDSYLFQEPSSGNSYRSIDPFRQYVLSDKELDLIAGNETLRLKIIDFGFHKSKTEKPFDQDRWFKGKYIVPYDKGADSDTESGWLPNYYVKTNYYIDWSSEAVHRLKTLTIRQRDGKGSNSICSRFQNKETYFSKGITFSITGVYAPSFRIAADGVYDVKGSKILVVDDMQTILWLGLLCSTLIKFISKNFIYHTVDMQVDAIKEIPISKYADKDIVKLVQSIIVKQKVDPGYSFSNNEQLVLDRLVYDAYGLNDSDIQEVENWYARRYPRLVRNEVLADS